MRLLFASLIVIAAAQAAVPKPAKAPRTVDARQLSVTISQSATSASPGARLSLYVDVRPKPTMHVYAPEQAGGYIRIALDLDETKAFRAAAPIFPKASNYYFEPLKETFKVFNAPFRIRQDITLAGPAGKRPLTITGTLRYQACDDLVCYRPDQVRVSWTVAPRAAASR